jgi:hypothetical protein
MVKVALRSHPAMHAAMPPPKTLREAEMSLKIRRTHLELNKRLPPLGFTDTQ